MNAPNATKQNEWSNPPFLLSFALAVFGMLSTGFASYLSFQTDTRDRVAKLEYRVDADEHTIASLQAARDDQGKIDNDIALRLDRLEHRH